MQRRRKRRGLRGALSLLLSAAVLWAVGATASAEDAAAAFAALKTERPLPVLLLKLERGDIFTQSALTLPVSLALSAQPLLLGGREQVLAAWSSELQEAPETQYDTEDAEGTVLSPPQEAGEITVTDNGMPSRTLKPSDPEGYLILGKTYINNASSSALSAEQLAGGFAAALSPDTPQVLIIHTHGTEAYTMPSGEEYIASDNHRTTDGTKNMLRIGDEIAETLTANGIGVIHDRALYDYPSYSGAYNRSLESIERYLAEYPSISFVLDIHRDAVEDAEGNEYKLLCEEEPRAAQLEFVIGSDGGGAQHERWRENLKLACAVQERILADYPTLMRPIVVRSSRYNQHMTTGSLLLEVGTAGNSLEEALISARIFASAFAETVGK